MGEWIKRMQYTYTAEYSLPIKKNGTPLFAAIWIEMEVVMLREISQTQKDKPCMFPSLETEKSIL